MDKCPVCNTDKPIRNITCSRECAAKKKGKVDWDKIDLEKKLKTQTINAIAVDLDVSWNSVKKRMKKLGIEN